MLDIVFILLIFFIVTATFLQEEGFDITPPPPNDEAPPEGGATPILVQITDENSVFVNQTQTSKLRVMAAVSRIRAEEPGSPVILEIADEAEHGLMIQIIDDLRASGIPVITKRPEAKGA